MSIYNFIILNWIEVTGALFGFLYLFFELKADIKMWPVGIVMSLFYVVVFIQKNFYAFALINVYYIFASIYGWIKWNKTKDEKIYVFHTPTKLYLFIFISILFIFFVISMFLKFFTDSDVILGDSFITTLSIVAMWMLAQRYIEQWLLLFVANIVSVYLYLNQSLYATSLLYGVFTLASIFGYFRWLKIYKENKNLGIFYERNKFFY